MKKPTKKQIDKVIRALALHAKPRWDLCHRGLVEILLKEAGVKIDTLHAVYEVLSQPPYEYAKKKWQYWMDTESYSGGFEQELCDVTEEEYKEAKQTGYAYDEWGREFDAEKLFIAYSATDKLPKDPLIFHIENMVDALYKFRDKELGKSEIVFILKCMIEHVTGEYDIVPE